MSPALEPDRASAALARRRFVFVTGKGGVGKTTVAAALALALAEQGRRVLVALCNTRERLSALLGSPPVRSEIGPVAERVWAVNIVPEAALAEYGRLVLGSGRLRRAVFENRVTRSFLRAVPGMHEWAMLGKAWYHTTERLPDGAPRFDVVVLDAPATGHGVDMLRVPRVILDVAGSSALRRDAEAAWELFRDPARAGVLVVTLAEELPATEAVELVSSIRGDLGLPVLALVVNAVHAPRFSPAERERLRALADLERDEPVLAALGAGGRRALREALESESLARLSRELDVPTIRLPALLDAATPEGVRRLAAAL